jgi:hypothetical protein
LPAPPYANPAAGLSAATAVTSTAAYMRQFRADHPDYVTRNKKRAAARTRALEKLARQYPDEFRRLYQAELADLDAADDTP